MNGAHAWAVRRACTTLTGASPLQVRRTSTGAGTAVYRALLADRRRVVVKLFPANCVHGAEEEAQVLTAIATSGRVAVPVVIGCGPVPGLNVTVLITADIGTSTMGQEVREGRMPRQAAMVRLALLLAAFHSVPPPSTARLALGIREQVRALSRHCPHDVFAQLTPALEVIAQSDAAKRTVWCHGDLHFDNVIRSYCRSAHAGSHNLPNYVVDFEASTACAPEYDLAQTLVTCDALTPADRLFLVAAYGGRIDTRLLDAFVVFQAVRGWTYAAHREGRHHHTWAARLQQSLNPVPYLRAERKG